MAAVLILEPIFEADLQPEQHAYRAGRSALEAVQAVAAHLDRGATEVVDADLSGYFDSIPHAELMKSVSRRIVDRHVLQQFERDAVRVVLEPAVAEAVAHDVRGPRLADGQRRRAPQIAAFLIADVNDLGGHVAHRVDDGSALPRAR